MEKYQHRVIEEKKDLEEKREKLSDFMHSETYGTLDAVEQGLLMIQLVEMNGYSDVLGRRIELF